MNIFVLDKTPKMAAIFQCDKHVVKMVLETAQMLCSAFENAPYKRTHVNHPCSKWVRESSANFDWLIEHGTYLAEEYTFRYGKTHKSKAVIDWCSENKNLVVFDLNELTPFALAMPEEYKLDSPVASYRNYYLNEKADIASWSNGRERPHWWKV